MAIVSVVEDESVQLPDNAFTRLLNLLAKIAKDDHARSGYLYLLTEEYLNSASENSVARALVDKYIRGGEKSILPAANIFDCCQAVIIFLQEMPNSKLGKQLRENCKLLAQSGQSLSKADVQKILKENMCDITHIWYIIFGHLHTVIDNEKLTDAQKMVAQREESGSDELEKSKLKKLEEGQEIFLHQMARIFGFLLCKLPQEYFDRPEIFENERRDYEKLLIFAMREIMQTQKGVILIFDAPKKHETKNKDALWGA